MKFLERNSKQHWLYTLALFAIVIFTLISSKSKMMSDPEAGIPSEKLQNAINEIRIKIGSVATDNFIKSILPHGYVAYCSKENGKSPDLIAAEKAYYIRNKTKFDNALQPVLDKRRFTQTEIRYLSEFAFIRVVGNIHKGLVSCNDVASKIEKGEWDF